MVGVRVTDMLGRCVEIPVVITRFASISPFVTSTALVLGCQDMLAGIDGHSVQNANLACLYPAVKHIPAVSSHFTLDRQALLRSDPQVILTITWERDPDETQHSLGIPVVCIDLDLYVEGIQFLAGLAGKEANALRFTDYYASIKSTFLDRVTGIQGDEKARVYVASKKGLLSTFGKESTWHYEIEAAGGTNLTAQFLEPGMHWVSQEQIVAWNPDVIILDQSCPDKVASVLNDPRWQPLNAIRNKRVFRAPEGFLGSWGRPFVESALTRLWLADLFYPGRLDLSIEAEIKGFYSEFFGNPKFDIHKMLNPE
jgi:iron complex transport system substrate-binding protein